MNTHQWYLNGSKSSNLVLPYLNWKDFGIRLLTIDNLPVSVDFGDGNIQTIVPDANENFYSKATASNGEVVVYNANRLSLLHFRSGGAFNPNWNFSLAVFRIATNLTSLDFRNGNIFGDASNLSPVLETFQILSPSFGILKNLSPMSSNLLNFNQTGINSDFLFIGSQIATEMPLLRNFTIAGKSKVEMSLADLPQYLLTIEISNTNPFTASNRRNRITYAPFTVGVPFANTPNTGMIRFAIDCENGYGFNSSELDSILINLASLTWNVSLQKLIRLTLGHGVRTSASDTAVATLIALPNMTVQLN